MRTASCPSPYRKGHDSGDNTGTKEGFWGPGNSEKTLGTTGSSETQGDVRADMSPSDRLASGFSSLPTANGEQGGHLPNRASVLSPSCSSLLSLPSLLSSLLTCRARTPLFFSPFLLSSFAVAVYTQRVVDAAVPERMSTSKQSLNVDVASPSTLVGDDIYESKAHTTTLTTLSSTLKTLRSPHPMDEKFADPAEAPEGTSNQPQPPREPYVPPSPRSASSSPSPLEAMPSSSFQPSLLPYAPRDARRS
jgi:hypothetical protein